MLAKLTGVDLSEVKRRLEMDASGYAEHGMHLEHIWKNADDPNEAFFLFRVEDLAHCKWLMERARAEACLQDPCPRVPEAIYLDGD